MPVLEPLKPMFDAMIAGTGIADSRPVTEVRQAMHAMIDASFRNFFPEIAPLPFERDYQVLVAAGSITVRLYDPAPDGPSRPIHVFLHSGGFWLGTLDQSDSVCRALASDSGCAVVSVGYRLAPEHKFPAAPEDAYVALCWVAAHAAELGLDPSRISIGGASAGGNLAAVVALMARDRGGPTLTFQALEIPVTDLTQLDPLSLPDEGLIVPSGKAEYRAHYLSEPEQAHEAYASPLLASDLSSLPPALVIGAEYDPLRAEGEAYARRLADAGVPAAFHLQPGQFHGSQYMATLIPDEVGAHRNLIASALREAHMLDC